MPWKHLRLHRNSGCFFYKGTFMSAYYMPSIEQKALQRHQQSRTIISSNGKKNPRGILIRTINFIQTKFS